MLSAPLRLSREELDKAWLGSAVPRATCAPRHAVGQVPEGQPIIAQRFTAGIEWATGLGSPGGTADFGAEIESPHTREAGSGPAISVIGKRSTSPQQRSRRW